MKLKFNIELLTQLSDRLRYTSNVYAAIPDSEINFFNKKGKNKRHLLRCLEVGLLTVRRDKENYVVKEVLSPKPLDRKYLQSRNKRKKQLLLNEFNGREKLSNVGGSTRVAIHTAYKELSIKIAKELHASELSIKEIKSLIGDNKKISSILQKNHYGWFERVDRGVYKLTDKGYEYIDNLTKK